MDFLYFIIPVIEVLVICIAINYLLSFFWATKSMDIVWGILAFALLFVIATWLKLPVLHKIIIILSNAAVIGFIVIFQPELRTALAKLSFKGKRNKEITEFDKFLDHLANTIYRLAERRIGAIIAIEKEDSLEEYAQKAVILNADFSSELLETIFAATTPLHDGAVIIRQRTILSAASILPLAEDISHISKAMGTRHRAGLGLSSFTDALVIVVSEETGRVSVAREGIMTKSIKIDRFKSVIRSIFNSPKITFQTKYNFREWLRK